MPRVHSNDPAVSWDWSTPADVSGIAGYSFQLMSGDGAPIDPGNTVDTLLSAADTTVPSDGSWYLVVKAQDGAGNWGEVGYAAEVWILTTPPQLQMLDFSINGVEPDPENLNEWYSAAEYEVTWSEWNSLVPQYSWVLDQEPSTQPDTVPDLETAPMGPVALDLGAVDEGVWYLHLKGADPAGNWSDTFSIPVRVDRTKPSAIAPQAGVHVVPLPGLSPVYLDTSDSMSGVDWVRYWFEGQDKTSASWMYSGDGVDLTQHGHSHQYFQDEIVTMHFEAVDYAGNATTGTATYYLDTDSPPITAIEAPAGWVRSATVTLTPDEPVKATRYQIDDGSWSEYSGPIALSEDGTHTVGFYSIDVVDNAEAPRNVLVRIDATAPVTTSDASASYLGTATVTLSATDTLSGVASTQYRLDGGAWTSGTSVTTSVGGAHTLEWRSTDTAGNVESTHSASFTVISRVDQTDYRVTYLGGWVTNSDGTSWRQLPPCDRGKLYRNVRIHRQPHRLIGPKSSSYGKARVWLDAPRSPWSTSTAPPTRTSRSYGAQATSRPERTPS